MSFYQKATRTARTALGPVGVAAAFGTSTSILLGRHTSSTTASKTNHIASHHLSAIARNHFTSISKATNTGTQTHVNVNQFKTSASNPLAFVKTQRRFASTIPKEIVQKKETFVPKEKAVPKTDQGNSNTSRGFVAWYESHLNARPVATKAVTGSILWGLGDFVAQVVPTMFQDDAATSDSDSTTSNGDSSSSALVNVKQFEYDYPRTARAVVFGFAIHAPLSHVHFNFLEWMTIRSGFQGLSIPVFKTVMEQFVYWSWFSNSLYHGAMGVMQGMTFDQVYNRIADVLWDTQKAQWVFWIPVQLLNFQFVPIRHQLNVVLLTSVVWTALLSAWYPPEDKEEAEEKLEISNGAKADAADVEKTR
jgi:protein Mpv17